MYQLDSWYAFLFELLLVGSALYHSLNMTKWWNTVQSGTAVTVRRSVRAPSVADFYKLSSKGKTKRSSKSSFDMFAAQGDAGIPHIRGETPEIEVAE